MAWVDGHHLPIIRWSLDAPFNSPKGYIRAFHGGTHHFLCYLSPRYLEVAPLENMVFSCFWEIPIFTFF
jgi:hypothetical protein